MPDRCYAQCQKEFLACDNLLLNVSRRQHLGHWFLRLHGFREQLLVPSAECFTGMDICAILFQKAGGAVFDLELSTGKQHSLCWQNNVGQTRVAARSWETSGKRLVSKWYLCALDSFSARRNAIQLQWTPGHVLGHRPVVAT